MQKRCINRYPRGKEIGDKDNLFRNLWHLGNKKQIDVFDYVPLTYSFRMREKEFVDDFQRFCQFFLSQEKGCHIEEIEPIRIDRNPHTNEEQPIFMEMDFELPQTIVQERKFKNVQGG